MRAAIDIIAVSVNPLLWRLRSRGSEGVGGVADQGPKFTMTQRILPSPHESFVQEIIYPSHRRGGGVHSQNFLPFSNTVPARAVNEFLRGHW